MVRRGYGPLVNEATSLEDLFERFESLPAQDAEDVKGQLVGRMLAAIADRLGAVGDGDRYRSVRAASARVRLLAPGADGFDDAVLQLIDATRDAFDEEPLAEVVPVRSPQPAESAEEDVVTEASEESFPASDPPGFAAGGDGAR
jgi:hypothetical protein